MKKKFISTLIIFIICILSVIGGLIYVKVIDKVRKNEYPELYAEEVSSSAAKFNVDKVAVYAVLKVSSGFDASKRENGKVGLYQLTIEKFRELAFEIGESDDERLRFVPSVSIDLCAYEISYCFTRYEDKQAAFAALYAGCEAVDKNLANNDGKFNLSAFDKETEEFVEDVTKAYEKYSSLYEETTKKAKSSAIAQ